MKNHDMLPADLQHLLEKRQAAERRDRKDRRRSDDDVMVDRRSSKDRRRTARRTGDEVRSYRLPTSGRFQCPGCGRNDYVIGEVEYHECGGCGQGFELT